MNTAFLRRAAILAFSATLAAGAHAVDTWTYTGVSGSAGVDVASPGAAALTTTGAYATNTGTSGITGNWSTNTSGNPSAALAFYAGGGLGMGSDGTGTPNHAIDNNGLYTEGVLLSFSSSTILTGINLGYVYGDADISVFRFKGSDAPSLNGTGAALSSMQAAGWELVGNYANLIADASAPYTYNLINGATNSASPTATSGSVGSSWWLITAYNTAYGTGANLNQGNDYFKLLSVAGSACTTNDARCGSGGKTNGTPEPATLALTGVALVGMLGLRRRKTRSAA